MNKGFIFSQDRDVNISCTDGEDKSVIMAIDNLKADISSVFGCTVNVTVRKDGETVSLDERRADTSEIFISTKNVFACIKDESALDRWEGYAVREDAGILYICGADRRGTIFGIYEVSRYIGVSPWYYFADVPVRRKKSLLITAGYRMADYPSVRYRGIFLNDEEELENWAVKHTPDHTIGPKLYGKIYELLLRLKGNYIWPAMHVNYFQENPENARLADEMGIVVGTSHCDMLMRSNQNEWNPWLKSRGYRSDYKAVHSDRIDNSEDEGREVIYYDYSIPGHNREVIDEYWRESVDMNRDYEVCYTVGMRGVHDYGFVTSRIDSDESLSDEEKEQQRIRLLENVISVQRKMLGEGKLQSFIPYKEVLDLYNKGLKVPDDVTLIWVDDNFGYVRRYPDANERMRSGGHGLYYHVSYWAAPDMSYLFINSIPMAQIFNELKKSYDSGIQKMWVLNVGALKPLEMETEAFIQYGWDAGKHDVVINDSHNWTVEWFNSLFSGNNGEQLALLYERLCQLTNARKIEHMTSNVFSQYGYGDEAGERLCELRSVFNQTNKIYDSLPEEEKEAFFELFMFKVHASFYHNCAYYYADRSGIVLYRGNNLAADIYTSYSDRMIGYLRNLLRYYNKDMCDGKWDEIMTPDSFPPPGINFYPVCRPSLRHDGSGMSVVLWDGRRVSGECRLEFAPGGVPVKWLDIGNMGMQPFHYQITCHADWIKISESEGTIDIEKRIYLTASALDEISGSEAVLRVVNIDSGQTECIRVVAGVAGSVSADGAICMYADDYAENEDDEYGAGWEMVENLGRGYGNAMMAVNTFTSDTQAYLEYRFFLGEPGSFEMEVIRYLTLEAHGNVSYGISVDDGEILTVHSESCDEWRGNWKGCVLNNGEKQYIMLPYLEAGEHSLRVYMIDDYVTISKFIIYTQKRRDTFFGYSSRHYVGDWPEVDWSCMDRIQNDYYKCNEDNIPEIVYADKNFFRYNRIYMKNDIHISAGRGQRSYSEYYDLHKGVNITDYFPNGVYAEQDGAVRIEAEYALLNNKYAYMSSTSNDSGWECVHAPSNGGAGLAMLSTGQYPGLHFSFSVCCDSAYKLWLLVYYENHMSDQCYLEFDGQLQPAGEQVCRGRMFNYSTMHIYFWCLMSEVNLSAGEHTLSIYAGRSGLQIDRIYITRGNELPPSDDTWN